MGSPWRHPRRMLKLSLMLPAWFITALKSLRRSETHLIMSGPKLKNLRVSRMKEKFMESNAFSKSILRTNCAF